MTVGSASSVDAAGASGRRLHRHELRAPAWRAPLDAGRSQITRALFHRAADGRHRASSPGSLYDPAGQMHPQVLEVMREVGIDLAGVHPQPLSRELAEQADVVVTTGCVDARPYTSGKRYLDWELPDVKDLPVDEVRAIREEIDQRVRGLTQCSGHASAGTSATMRCSVIRRKEPHGARLRSQAN